MHCVGMATAPFLAKPLSYVWYMFNSRSLGSWYIHTHSQSHLKIWHSHLHTHSHTHTHKFTHLDLHIHRHKTHYLSIYTVYIYIYIPLFSSSFPALSFSPSSWLSLSRRYTHEIVAAASVDGQRSSPQHNQQSQFKAGPFTTKQQRSHSLSDASRKWEKAMELEDDLFSTTLLS